MPSAIAGKAVHRSRRRCCCNADRVIDLRDTAMKLCVNSRDELIIMDLDLVACFAADGNYTTIQYIEGQKVTASIGLSKMESLVSAAYPKGEPSPFVRLGRSLLVNQNYLCHINVQKQRLVLSDLHKSSISINVTKNLLKTYKQFVSDTFRKSVAAPQDKQQNK